MNKEILSILACPKCKGDLKAKGNFIVCEKCKLAFPVLEKEVPDMLMKDALQLRDARRAGFKHNIRL